MRAIRPLQSQLECAGLSFRRTRGQRYDTVLFWRERIVVADLATTHHGEIASALVGYKRVSFAAAASCWGCTWEVEAVVGAICCRAPHAHPEACDSKGCRAETLPRSRDAGGRISVVCTPCTCRSRQITAHVVSPRRGHISPTRPAHRFRV
jgi:hypothetical protein